MKLFKLYTQYLNPDNFVLVKKKMQIKADLVKKNPLIILM